MSREIIEIDGSYLEGGGQILRNALSLSCILCRPVRVIRIRANRPNPGLSNQHLYGLNILQQITNARVCGNSLKSTEVEFHPGAIRAGDYFVDTQTAAAVSLVLQAVLPVLMFGGSTSWLEVIGGTNVGMAPQVDYMTEVLRPNLEAFGVSFDFDLMRRGYFPRGGGRCKVTVPAVQHIRAAKIIHFGQLVKVEGWCFVAGRLPLRLAEDMKKAAEAALCGAVDKKPDIEAYKENDEMARDNGAGLVLVATSSMGCVVGSSALGDPKKPIDGRKLGTEAGRELAECIAQGLCVDKYTQDQLVLFMALASGVSSIRTCKLTDHTRTAMHVATLMVGVKFDIVEDAGGIVITCHGVAHQNSNLN